MYTLRPYQIDAVHATLSHFRGDPSPAVIVLPTGAGKSLVIAELARLARGRVLVMAHVRELVEQNYAKYVGLGLVAGIFSAGLGRKERDQKTIFGSIQSLARAEPSFFANFSLVVIDECHRVSMEGTTQYAQVLAKLDAANPRLRVLGLTATPYRLGFGWIYEHHGPRKIRRSESPRFFTKCIFELSTRYMIDHGYLTPPVKIDSPVASYDFSSLRLHGTSFVTAQIERLLKDQKRITPVIIANIVELAAKREGVMIFTASVAHAQEIMRALPPYVSAMVVGDTESTEREATIAAFKARKLKFLVNVSVLTTGFDAPHVDVIALLRPTESASLYQQIIGRGLRLSPGKVDCLILDYTGQGHDLFSPQIEVPRPASGAKLVDVECPACPAVNEFWGMVNPDGLLLEHFGRRCSGCGFRFRFKRCDKCGAENDIAARVCAAPGCGHLLIDNDQRLKAAMALKDAHVLKVDSMDFLKSQDRRGKDRLEVRYYDADANALKEYFYLDGRESRRAFYYNFVRMHQRLPETPLEVGEVDAALALRDHFRAPMFVIARQIKKRYWTVREKIFDERA